MPTECRKCALYKFAKTNCMPTSGDPDAEILLVGEGPGEEEDSSGVPFVGKSGRLLRDALERAGVRDFAITNVVRCRPPHNATPIQAEISECMPYLLDDIDGMPNLRLIVAVGNIALRALTGKQGITKSSGEEWEFTTRADKKIKLMPLIHPSYVLQNATEMNSFYDHVARIPMILVGELTGSDLGDYVVMDTPDKWENFRKELLKHKIFSYDTETTGLNSFDEGARIKCIQFSYDLRTAYVLPLYNPGSGLIGELKEIFENKKIGKIGQNIKFDNLWMKTCLGIEVKGTIWDTKVAEYLLVGKGSTGLKEMAYRYSKLGGYEKGLSDSPEKIDGEELWHYGAIDADLTYRIFKQQLPKFKEYPAISHLMKTLMIPVSDVLMKMEFRGIRVDKSRVAEANTSCEELIEQRKKEMKAEPCVIAYEEFKEEAFNPNSHQQIAAILFKVLNLPVIKKTGKSKAPATDQEVLENFAGDVPLCQMLLDYSQYNQMKKTFLKELVEYERNERIHTTLWVTETVTGRTSSKKPNMQNMPKGDKDILNLRKCFIADPGYVLAEFDMSQHELRVMGEMAHDDLLIEDLKGDIHRATTASCLGIRPENVTPEQRDKVGKPVNFGVIYAMTKWGLANQLKISENEAELWLARFFERYYKVKRFQDATIKFVKEFGYTEAMSGRRRYFPSWEEFDDNKIKEMVNFPIQATASDILLYGAIAVERLLRGRKSFLVLEVHDSLLINLHKSELSLIDEIKDLMCNDFRKYIYVPFESPLKVDVKIGDNWGSMEKI